MPEKNQNPMYNTTDIYFGQSTYNAYPDGYFKTSPEAFVKTVDQEGKEKYKKLKGKGSVSAYIKDTPDYLSVSDLVCLDDLVPQEKRDSVVSVRIINLYLLKYKFTNSRKKQYANGFGPQKTKK